MSSNGRTTAFGAVYFGSNPSVPAHELDMITHTYFKSRKSLLIILGVVSLVCSRMLFTLINDPEGPNLLIVLVTAIIVYFIFLAVFYIFQKFGIIKK